MKVDIHRRELLRSLEEDLGYIFEKPQLLEQALMHKSFANETGEKIIHNERMEFLGDSVLGISVTRLLYDIDPPLSEGDMSRIRAYLVKEETLAQIARTLNLGEHLRLGRGEAQSGGADKPSILSNAFEALVGAIYLDGGFELAFSFIESIYGPVIEDEGPDAIRCDYKTRLQEYCQARYKKTPVYKSLGSSGPDHDKVFTVEILLGTRSLAKGTGHSKKEAEQMAARHALAILE
ncbi:ribonuclease III [bacterium]|nr:MAG: ribonuclease III [bacterium]